MNEPTLFDVDTLAMLGRLARDVYWQTPLYQTYGLDGEKHEYYRHRNDQILGTALVNRLKAAPPEVLRDFLDNFTGPEE